MEADTFKVTAMVKSESFLTFSENILSWFHILRNVAADHFGLDNILKGYKDISFFIFIIEEYMKTAKLC